ncbi:Endoplasmic reticulum transmembrane protein 3 [Savitreella phatthalungensis]
MNIPSILVSILLGLECLGFFVLTLPAKSSVRSSVVRFVEDNGIALKIWHFWRIALIFVGLLFADAIRGIAAKRDEKSELTPNDKLALAKLMAQRNMYLCGSCLLVAYAIWRVEALVKELQVKTEVVKKAE